MIEQLTTSRNTTAFGNKKVLLIEDEEPLIERIKKKLVEKGFDVLTAYSMREVMKHLDREDSDNLSVIFIEKSKRILVIEDDQALIRIIQKKLELNGFSVLTARSVNQALSLLDETDDIDAIWLDHYLLGEETGLDFVSALEEQNLKDRKPPIFVVSNVDTLAERQLYNALGVSKYFNKAHYRLDQIVEDIKQFLAKQKVAR